MAQSEDPDIAKLYHLHSSSVRCRLGNTALDLDRRPHRYRTYPGSQRVDLSGRDYEFAVPLGTVMQQRRSVREYCLRALDLAAVGRLLYASYGLQGYRQVGGEWIDDRRVPSAGGLYPLELYVATQAIDGLPDGVYHYDARAHQLELRRSGPAHADLGAMTTDEVMVRDANLVVVISAIFQRTMWKYGQRGYRYIWLDAGHVGQNLYLCATALGLGAVAIGGFFDDELNGLLGLPPGEEEAIYMICVGQVEER